MKNASWYWEWTSDTTDEAVEIIYNFDGGDAGVMYYADGSGTPPDPPSVEIVALKYKGVDMTNLLFALMGDDVFDEIELEIAEYEQDGGNYDPTDFNK